MGGPKTFHDEKCTNQTHQSTADPDARLFRKGPGKEAKLSFMGHALMDNRHGVAVATKLTQTSGKAEVTTGESLLKRSRRAKTVVGDKAFDQVFFVTEVRKRGSLPMSPGKKCPFDFDETYVFLQIVLQ